MLGKSLVAGTVLTLLAGGAVYYGTDVDGNISAKAGLEKLESFAGDKTSRADKASGKDVKTSDSEEVETSSEASADESVNHPHAGHGDEATKHSADIPAINSELIDPKSGSMSGTIREAARDEDAELKIDVESETEENLPDASEAHEDIEAETNKEADTSSETPTRKWIDQYLKSESKSENVMAEDDMTEDNIAEDNEDNQAEAEAAAEIMAQEASDAEAEAAMEAEIDAVLAQEEALERELTAMMAEMSETETLEEIELEEAELKEEDAPEMDEASTGLLTDKEILEAEAKGFEDRAKAMENIWADTEENHAEDDTKTLHDALKGHGLEGHKKEHQSELEYEVIDTDQGKTIKIRKMKTADVDPAEEQSDVSKTAKLIMAQAKKISMSELRDRAYLDLVSYALDNGDKAVAIQALSKIEQVELRDTARNRMAVSYARNGNAEKAFAILEEIEVEALRDVMRLQVIEALIVPEAPAPAPQDMQ